MSEPINQVHGVTQADYLWGEYTRLLAAVKEHHDQKADDRCWLDDDKLYAAAGLGPPARVMESKAAMLQNCQRYIERRMIEGPDGWESYQKLELRIDDLQEALAPMAGYFAVERDPGWDKARDEFLLIQPCCQVCGTKNALEVHHKYPVHFPGGKKLELVQANMITLCRVHHFIFGHLGDWLARNPTVDADCLEWQARYKAREYANVA